MCLNAIFGFLVIGRSKILFFTWSLIGNNSCHFDTKATPLQPLKSVISTRHFNTRPTLFKPPKILIKTVTFTRHFDKNPSLRQKTQRILKAPKNPRTSFRTMHLYRRKSWNFNKSVKSCRAEKIKKAICAIRTHDLLLHRPKLCHFVLS